MSDLKKFLIPATVKDPTLRKYFPHTGEYEISIPTTVAKSISPVTLKSFLIRVNPTFPLKRFYIDGVAARFDNLCKKPPTVYTKKYTMNDIAYKSTAQEREPEIPAEPKYQDQYLIFTGGADAYECNIIADLFNEHARVVSVVNGKNSSADLWKTCTPDDFLLESIKNINKFGGLNSENFRESMYCVVSEPTAFRATVYHDMMRLFAARRTLDFCSGWGDRLLGALAYSKNAPQFVEYVGCDPNVDVFHGYASMIDYFATDKSKFTTINQPFEKTTIDGKFDFIFTGPPYFDYEIYGSDRKGQSISTAGTMTVDQWAKNYLFVWCKKAIELLETDGNLVINISDTKSAVARGSTYVEAMLFYISTNPYMEYKGVISFSNEFRIIARPMWVFHKNTQPNHARAAKFDALLRKYYPGMC
jgi:hypothetical protein